ncbi:ABC transporter permease [Leucobacter aridicollis]|uniref:NitT/TauT family transport system permease protein n=1 Tax=Leucobacter aridicollis TaxID=283878 RepID=A0A852RIS5_9MICO|nr:ABC transporter permease subunit [Leucobacter aridicollis]MBL3680923.1 ABC transporter permease subunit [Leucobacter aridicollis]NYD28074.1 NitT/TauT family transport system permease protein [Leucobacter aridicollis]
MTLTRNILVPKRTRKRVNWDDLRSTLLVLVSVIVVWQGAVTVFGVPSFILPAPLDIITHADWPDTLRALGQTSVSTALGFVAGNAVGYIGALLISASPTLSRIIFPGAIVFRSIPVVALAPFITLAVGRGAAATVVVAALIVFFPTLINSLQGLRSVRTESLELMRILNASRLTTYLRVRIPASMPSFFSALRIAAPNAVLGVMTAEWIVGGGLGNLVITSWLALRMPTMWSAVLASAVLAAVLFSVVSLCERSVVRWARSQ